MITEIIILFIVFLGVIFGFLLSLIAQEELKPGLKYLKLWKFSLLLIIIIVAFFYIPLPLASFIGLMLVLLYFDSKEYVLLSALFYVSTLNQKFFILESSLMFIYGIPTAAIFTASLIRKKKTIILKELLKEYSLFLVFGIILLII